jgi:serine/threonine protein kinase
MTEDSTLWHTSATSAPGTVRWKAPELLSGEQRTVTASSDMYAFAMTCFVSQFTDSTLMILFVFSFRFEFDCRDRKYTLVNYHSINIGTNGC